MAIKSIADGLFMIPGFVNMYLIDAPGQLTLVDTGFPKSEGKVLDALRGLGRSPNDLKHIVLTHAHPDHIGSAAAIAKATGARTYIHALDAPIAERGAGFRPMTAAPGLLANIMFRIFFRPNTSLPAVRIDQRLTDGDVLPIAGGLEVIHVPGHCAGQVALLWRERGVLFAADTCVNLFGLGPPIGYEERALGERSQRLLAGREFAIACFGHGNPLRHDAAAQFRKTWPPAGE